MVIGKALQGNKPPLSCFTRRSCVQRPRRSLHETHTPLTILLHSYTTQVRPGHANLCQHGP